MASLLLAGLALCGSARASVLEPAAAPSLARERMGGVHEVAAAAGDSLTSVAARFGVSVPALARANGLAADARLALGQTLRVENPHLVPAVTAMLSADAILINVPQRMLFQRRRGAVVAAYPVAAGRPSWRTPIGEFEIEARATDKPWIVPLSIQDEMRREGKPVKTIVPPGPENPLGRHWLGLSRSSCGIHGTNAPASVYALRTHGCIRLHPDDAAALYERTPLGETVTIVYEPLLLGALADGRVCLEVHPDAYRRSERAPARLELLAAENGLTKRIDWARAREVLGAQEGVAIDVTLGALGGPCS
jgi:L,D-transpeptidase ErfK/SrfK